MLRSHPLSVHFFSFNFGDNSRSLSQSLNFLPLHPTYRPDQELAKHQSFVLFWAAQLSVSAIASVLKPRRIVMISM